MFWLLLFQRKKCFKKMEHLFNYCSKLDKFQCSIRTSNKTRFFDLFVHVKIRYLIKPYLK